MTQVPVQRELGRGGRQRPSGAPAPGFARLHALPPCQRLRCDRFIAGLGIA